MRFIIMIAPLAALAIMCAISAWVQHVILCIQHQEWFLLIAGAIIGPIGVIHGVGYWLGAFTQ